MRLLSTLFVLCSAAVIYGCGGSGGGEQFSVPRQPHDLGNFVSQTSRQATGSGMDAGIVDSPDFSTPGSGSMCGSVTSTGGCSGTVLEYCDTSSGNIVSMDCASNNQVCTVSGGFPNCTTPSGGGSGGSCGAVDSNGICNGNVLEYCIGTLVMVDCSKSGTSCTVDSSTGFADCT